MKGKFRTAAFEFARKVSSFEVLHLVLFGSVSRDEEDKRSDLDFLVVIDTEGPADDHPDHDRISQAAFDVEKRHDCAIQIVFANRSFAGLDDYFVQHALAEGTILYSRAPRIELEGMDLEPHVIIHYSLQQLNQSQKMTFRNRLYGYRSKREYKDKVYRHQTPGLLKETGGDKLGLATIMVPRRNLKRITDFLDKSNATYRTREVWMYR